MRNLVMILLGLALIIGLSAGPAMAGTPGTVLFFDDFEGATLGGVPDNGGHPGTWVETGDATVQDSNPFDGNQHMRREQLNGSSHPVIGNTLAAFESVATSGDIIHFEAMLNWPVPKVEGGNNNFNDGFGLAPADGSEFLITMFPLQSSFYYANSDSSVAAYFVQGNDFENGEYHKVEILHEVGTADYRVAVNGVSEKLTSTAPSSDVGLLVFRQGNDFLQMDWDNVSVTIVPEPVTSTIVVTGLLSLACLRRSRLRR